MINMSDLVDVVDERVIYSGMRPEEFPMSTPLYEQLAEHVRQQIRAGTLKPGDRLPSQSTLKDEGWTHGVIIAAMRELKNGGWTRGQPGQAVYVVDHPPV